MPGRAIAGPLLGATLIGLLGISATIVLSLSPGLIAAVAIIVAARQARNIVATPVGSRPLGLNLGEPRRVGLHRTLVPVSDFEMGNLAATLLILRATTMLEAGGHGAATAVTMVILMYACREAMASAAALVGGELIDKVNPRLAFTLCASLYVATYRVFAAEGSHPRCYLPAFCSRVPGSALQRPRSRPRSRCCYLTICVAAATGCFGWFNPLASLAPPSLRVSSGPCFHPPWSSCVRLRG